MTMAELQKLFDLEQQEMIDYLKSVRTLPVPDTEDTANRTDPEALYESHTHHAEYGVAAH